MSGGTGSNLINYLFPKPYGRKSPSSGGIKRFNSMERKDGGGEEARSDLSGVRHLSSSVSPSRSPDPRQREKEQMVFTANVFTPMKFTSGREHPGHQRIHFSSKKPKSPSPMPSLVRSSDDSTEYRQQNLPPPPIPQRPPKKTPGKYAGPPLPTPPSTPTALGWEVTLKKNAQFSPLPTPPPPISPPPPLELYRVEESDVVLRKQSAKRRNRRRSLTNSAGDSPITVGMSQNSPKNLSGSLTTTTSSTFNTSSTSPSSSDVEAERVRARRQQKKKKKKRRKSKSTENISKVKSHSSPPPELPPKASKSQGHVPLYANNQHYQYNQPPHHHQQVYYKTSYEDYPVALGHQPDPTEVWAYYNERDYQFNPYANANYARPKYAYDQVDSTALPAPARPPMPSPRTMTNLILARPPPPSPFMDQSGANPQNFNYNYSQLPDFVKSPNEAITNGKIPLQNSKSAPHISEPGKSYANGDANIVGVSSVGFPVRRLQKTTFAQPKMNGHVQNSQSPIPNGQKSQKAKPKSILKYKSDLDISIKREIEKMEAETNKQMRNTLSTNRRKFKRAIEELDTMYKDLGLSDDDLLDRAERRDLPTEHQMLRHQPRLADLVEGSKTQGNSNGSTQSVSVESGENGSFMIEDVGDENWDSLWRRDSPSAFKFKGGRGGSDLDLYNSCLRSASGASLTPNQARVRAPPLRRSNVIDKFGDDLARRRWTSFGGPGGGGSNLELHRFGSGEDSSSTPSQQLRLKKHLFHPYQQSYLALSPVELSPPQTPLPYTQVAYLSSPIPQEKPHINGNGLNGHTNGNGVNGNGQFYSPVPYSPLHEYYDEDPQLLLDDMTYRNYKRSNAIRIIEPQPPFGIPLGPISPAPNSDYLHAIPQERFRPLYRHLKHPDLIKDDQAFRNLRKETSSDGRLVSTALSQKREWTPKLFPQREEIWRNPAGVVLRRSVPIQGSRMVRPVSSCGSLENIRKYYNPFYFDYDEDLSALGKKRVIHLEDEISRWNSMSELERSNYKRNGGSQIKLRPPPANPTWQKRISPSRRMFTSVEKRPASSYMEPSWVEQIESAVKLVEEQQRRRKNKQQQREVGDGCEASPVYQEDYSGKEQSPEPVKRKPWTDVLIESFKKEEEEESKEINKCHNGTGTEENGKSSIKDCEDEPEIETFRPTSLKYKEN